ncbi:nucleocapsid protein [Colocasia bobone disease-associated virus]|uniref:Nucleoprotein n=1 Tax=Colocasia bobone disease-associated virus TaxID=1775456 RepID=A0A0U2NLG8_9RHAB|nr:nucleocapsid protein [Colocasia bobone disease-associated virus]ALU34429.1 nucleocapsid protein [Colocasia bobone disease-associated virus]
MAQHTIDAKITALFDGIPEDVCLGPVTGVKFTNDAFDALTCYRLEAVADAKVRYMAEKAMSEIFQSAATCKDYHPYMILTLASQLYTPGKSATTKMVVDYFPTSQTGIPTATSDEWKLPTKNTSDTDTTQIDDEAAVFTGRTAKAGNATVKEVCFASAFLLRGLVKTVTNITKAFEKLGGRFVSLYNLPKDDTFVCPPAAWLTSYKEFLTADPMIARTWIKIVAAAEQGLDAGSNDMGVLRFLACQPLSYSGMHAMKLYLTIKDKTKLSHKWLLEKMVMPATTPALTEIANLLKNFESTESAKKPTKFRYARLGSPVYFQKLQTKNCLELVFLEVCILNHFTTFAEDYQNPTKIVGVERIPEAMKTKLKAAANAIVSRAPVLNPSLYSDIMSGVFLSKTEASTSGTAAQTSGTKLTEQAIFG